MIASNRLLLQRIATLQPTTLRIGRSTVAYNGFCLNSSRRRINVHSHFATDPSRFLSTSSVQVDHEDKSPPIAITEDEVAQDKIDIDISEEVSTQTDEAAVDETTSNTDVLSAKVDGDGEETSPAEPTQNNETADTAEDGSVKLDDEGSQDESVETSTAESSQRTYADVIKGRYDNIPPDEVIRKGKIDWVYIDKMYGEIVQDEVYRDVGPVKKKKVFLHFDRIYHELPTQGVGMKPFIEMSRRVQFQAKPDLNNKDQLNAFNVRYEGGKDIPLLQWPQVKTVIKKLKARLGHNIYGILSENAEGKDYKEITKKVLREGEKCNEHIELARKQISNKDHASKAIKARLGDDIYYFLSNIEKVDNIQRKTDAAFFQCVSDLNTLGLNLRPRSGGELGPKGRYARTAESLSMTHKVR